MKKLFIIPTLQTNVLPNNNLYCKVYKCEEVNNFNIKEKYKKYCEWLLEISIEDIDEYILFYSNYINQQLDKHPKLEGQNYKEMETAIDTFTLLICIRRFPLNYLDRNTLLNKFFYPLSNRLKEYTNSTGDLSLLEHLDDYHPDYIRYWYNFNNYTTCK